MPTHYAKIYQRDCPKITTRAPPTTSLPEGLGEYLEAILNDTLPSYYRRLFQSKKDDYSDELPSCDVRLLINPLKTPRLTQYKCQGNYVLGLCLTLRGIIADGVITDTDIQKEIGQFLESDLNFQVSDPTNQQRIDSINRILDRVLGSLGQG